MKITFEEVISKILLGHKLDPKRAGAYLESIAFQIEEFHPEEDEFIREQLIQAGKIAASYPNPTYVLRELDNATQVYLRRHKSFDLFERITLPSPTNSRSIDDFQEELDFLMEEER